MLLRAQGTVEPEGRWIRLIGTVIGLVAIIVVLVLVDPGTIGG